MVWILSDGAYGTQLSTLLNGDETADDLCIRDPRVVTDCHRRYLEAGARTLGTNAFLAHLRRSDRRRSDLQRSAISCAREAVALSDVGEPVNIVATIGPAGTEARHFWRDLELLLEEEVRSIRCETITSRAIADAVIGAWGDVARGVTDATLRLGCSIAPSAGAESMAWVRELAIEAPQEHLIGLNCCEGPLGLRPVLEALCDVRGHGWVAPSAGIPAAASSGELRWPFGEPSSWAEAVHQLVEELPVAEIGGCCGTTPGHIEAMGACR